MVRNLGSEAQGNRPQVEERVRSASCRRACTATRSPSAVMPSTSSSGEPIMKSMCWALSFTRGIDVADPRGTGSRCRARCGSRRSRRAACCRRPCRAGRSGRAGRRGRARRGGALLVDVDERAEGGAVLVRLDLDGDAVLEAHAQSADDRAVAQGERLRRRHVTLGAKRVRRREHLFGRQVRQVPKPVGALEVGRPPVVRREHPDRQLGAGPAQLDRVERDAMPSGRLRPSARPCARPRRRSGRARRAAGRARAPARAARTPRHPPSSG